MDIRSKLLAHRFKDNNYFTNLNEYINDLVDENKISYKNLKYLYSKMYLFKSLFIKQNIYQVGEFLSKGYTPKEAEQIASLLRDASKLSVFCYSKKEQGHVYNKLFKELEYYYNLYDKEVKRTGNKEIAFKITKNIAEEKNKESEYILQQKQPEKRHSVSSQLKDLKTKSNKSKNKVIVTEREVR